MTPTQALTLAEVDAAFEAEIARVSHVEYDSNEICRHFYGKLRERLAALSAAPAEPVVIPQLTTAAQTALAARLLEHAAIHDAETSPYSPEQAQWADDLREAAALLSAAPAGEPVAPVECTCPAEDMPFGRCCKAPAPKQTGKWESARVADYNQGWNDCLSTIHAGQSVPPWGCAIVDKNGDEVFTRPRLSRFFGAENTERPPLDAIDQAAADREWPGMTPHHIVTLYAAPAAPQE